MYHEGRCHDWYAEFRTYRSFECLNVGASVLCLLREHTAGCHLAFDVGVRRIGLYEVNASGVRKLS